MSLVDSAVVTLHVLFAGLWTGSVFFVVIGVLPAASGGSIDGQPLRSIADRLRTLSRVSAIILLLTGGHMAGSQYTISSLTGTAGGSLVLAMLALWGALAALVEVGAGRITDGTREVPTPESTRAWTRPLRAGGVVALALLVVGGLLAAGV